jgi:hypothetical protein
MELANLVEKFLDLHTYRTAHQESVEVFWRGKDFREYILADQETIERLGRLITVSSTVEDEPSLKSCDTSFPGPLIIYILRRGKPVGPLIAQDPSPESVTLSRDRDDQRFF